MTNEVLEKSSSKKLFNLNSRKINTFKLKIGIVILAAIIAIISVIQLNSNIIKATKSYVIQLEERLQKGDKLSIEEQELICQHFLQNDVDKYRRYCLNLKSEEEKYMNLFEEYIIDSMNLSIEERDWINQHTIQFMIKCQSDRSGSKNTLFRECADVFQSYKRYVGQKQLGINVNTDKLSLYKIINHSYLTIKSNPKLLNLNYIYVINNKKFVINRLSILHIVVRHFDFKTYYVQNKSTLDKYITYDELIWDLDRIFTALKFNPETINKSLYKLNSHNYILDFVDKTSNLEFTLNIENINSNEFAVKSFYIYNINSIPGKDSRPDRLTNKHIRKIVNNFYIYLTNEN